MPVPLDPALLATLRAFSAASSREHFCRNEILAGRFPPFLRQREPVHLERDGHTLTVHVAPDYLALGSDDAPLRVPLTPQSAQAIGHAVGCMLPTDRLVDAIFAQAAVRLRAYPIDSLREGLGAVLAIHAKIERDWVAQTLPRGSLTAGHKKDVVLDPELELRPKCVGLYGWYRGDGSRIQPLYTRHSSGYYDYSHGARLVEREGVYDGAVVDLWSLLCDPAKAGILLRKGHFVREFVYT